MLAQHMANTKYAGGPFRFYFSFIIFRDEVEIVC